MSNLSGLLSFGFLTINLQFALVTAIAALFFAFSEYLQILGVNPATAGFIISADSLAALIIQPLIAPLIHSGTARRWLLGGSLLLSYALFMLAHVTSVPLLAAGRVLQGAGFICVLSALITMVVRYIPPEMSGSAFGLISLIRLVPYAVIPLFFDLMSVAPASFASLLKVAAFAALVPVLAMLLPGIRQSHVPDDLSPPGLSGMAASLRSRPVQLLLFSTMLFFSSYAAVFFFLKQFGRTLGISNTSFFFTVATLVMIVVRLSGGLFFDRCNKVWLCIAGLLLVAGSYGLLPLCNANNWFFLLAGFVGLGWGIAMPLQSAVMFDISAPSVRAMNQNLQIVMMQGGFFIGPFAGGHMIAGFGYAVFFITLAAMVLVSGVMMMGIKAPLPGKDFVECSG